MENIRNNQAFDILSKLIKKNAIRDEEQAFIDEWKKENRVNRQIYAFATTQLSIDSLPENAIDYNAIYHRIKNSINKADSESKDVSKKMLPKPFLSGIWKYAAVFALGIVSTMTAMYLIHTDTSSDILSEITVPNGSVSEILLPDSSVVTINSNSKLSYAGNFLSGQRMVNLEGEAFFKVKKQMNGNDFIVCSKGTQILVKGTEFNVRAYQDSPTIEATLVKGAIIFCADKKSIPLKPNQRITFDTNNRKTIVQKASVEDTEWRNGRYTFKDISLKEVIPILNRIYNTHITVDPSSQEIVFSGRIDRNNPLSHSLDVITLTTGTKYNALNDTIYIKK